MPPNPRATEFDPPKAKTGVIWPQGLESKGQPAPLRRRLRPTPIKTGPMSDLISVSAFIIISDSRCFGGTPGNVRASPCASLDPKIHNHPTTCDESAANTDYFEFPLSNGARRATDSCVSWVSSIVFNDLRKLANAVGHDFLRRFAPRTQLEVATQPVGNQTHHLRREANEHKYIRKYRSIAGVERLMLGDSFPEGGSITSRHVASQACRRPSKNKPSFFGINIKHSASWHSKIHIKARHQYQPQPGQSRT
ncbi:hypothetical protein V8F33_010126 [Rhypophila sp. PSN 637]